jgi:predicted permease
MNSIIASILSIYLFIVMGYLAKRSFGEKIDDKTITILNVYFLQVFLTFWGLFLHPVDITLLYAPGIYLLIIAVALLIAALFAPRLFKHKKEYSIAMVAAIIGNTGNLGIPLNIAIFGEASIPYTTVVNLVNVFVVYTLGVYFYSRGSFDVATSLKNIFKLPILWAALIAIALSTYGYHPPEAIMKMLMMGAYASMTMQLLLFGIYLYGTKIKTLNRLLISWVMLFKFLLLPLLAFAVLYFIELQNTLKGIIFIELLMPLAVANVNLASLYDCQPKTVTALVLISSLLFLGIIFIGVRVLSFL